MAKLAAKRRQDWQKMCEGALDELAEAEAIVGLLYADEHGIRIDRDTAQAGACVALKRLRRVRKHINRLSKRA